MWTGFVLDECFAKALLVMILRGDYLKMVLEKNHHFNNN